MQFVRSFLPRWSVPGLALGLALGVVPMAACGQGGVDDPLLHDLRVLAHDSLQGRATGSEGGRLAREYLTRRLGEVGLMVRADTFEVRRRDGVAEGVNLSVRFDGTEFGERAIIATAHYDHLGVRDGEIYNGADDNASGTAGLLALARWLALTPPRHSVILVFTDAEEGGLQGARHFVADPPMPLNDMLLEINLDMVGHSSSELWVSGTYPWPALRPLVESVEAVAPVVLRFGHDTPADRGADNWIMASDHGPFHQVGIPFLYFGVADHPDYHRPTDDVATIDVEFFRAAIETVRRVFEAADATLDGRRPGG